MRKTLTFILAILLLTASCTKERKEERDTISGGLFVEIKQEGWHTNYSVYYDRDTKVMYVKTHGTYGADRYTVLYNADGTPRVWKGDNQNEQ